MKHSILVVDDNRTNLQIVREVLGDTFTLQLANSGRMALRFVQKKKPDLILLDLMMPEMDGKETFEALQRDPGCRGIPVIFLTANQDTKEEVECLKMGALDFILKPIIPEVLERRISRTIELLDFQKHLQEKIDEKTMEINVLAIESIFAIVHGIEAKDDVTEGHSVRVASCSKALAKAMGFDDLAVDKIYHTALLHDVGKIGIPDSILKKTDNLTPQEYAQIQLHTTIGADILSPFRTMDYLADGALYHHERYDGKGYPMGLKEEQIPLIGRILAVADVYDALISKRHYKGPMEKAAARQELLDGSGTQFDPDILSKFIDLIDAGVIEQAMLESEQDSERWRPRHKGIPSDAFHYPSLQEHRAMEHRPIHNPVPR